MTHVLSPLFMLAMIMIPTHIVSATTVKPDVQIYFLDVGQGDAAILHQPGFCTALIDAGPLLHGHRVTAKLEELGVTDLDLVIITHPHLDHFGGLFDLAQRVSIKTFYDNGGSNQAWEYFDDYRALRRRQPYKTLKNGDVVECGSLVISVLHPRGDPGSGFDLNATSLVLMITYRDFRLMHMGDLAGSAEKKFLKQADDINADAIKIAHHGAADATSDLLLEMVQPEFAVISTTAENRIESPSDIVLDRLLRHNITYYRTDQDRTIRLDINEQGYRITSP